MYASIGGSCGGFRFIYAAFLQQAAEILNNKQLEELSLEMMKIGDLWRDFAVNASRVYKQRSNQENVYEALSAELIHIADLEEAFFKKLKKAI